MRFGTAIRPFAMSENVHTTASGCTEPTITAMTQRTRYGLMTREPKRYSAAFSP